jgi:hypothetical protein
MTFNQAWCMGAKCVFMFCVLAVVRHGDRTPKQKLKVWQHACYPAVCGLGVPCRHSCHINWSSHCIASPSRWGPSTQG